MLEILYEDEALLFINKPPDIVVQRSYDPNEPELLDVAQQHAGKLFLMQRLDRGTSGVIFFSKLAEINSRITRTCCSVMEMPSRRFRRTGSPR